MSHWWAELAAVFAKDWRSEARTRTALNTLGLFALTTLVLVGIGLGPLGVSAAGVQVLPFLLWLVLLFATTSGLPRLFVHEEETGTATALRLAARPSAVFWGKLAHGLSLTLALELLVTPLFLAMVQLPVERPLLLVVTLAAGGFGLAAASTVIAAIIAQAQGRATLFAVLSFPLLVPLLLLVVELTRNAITGEPAGEAMRQLLLYDGTLAVAGSMLFPVIWNP
ncbi:MAG TPA: heme exporter protein CcmB [Thermoanaerobaculia bacterium]|nr:heme exporter protein CcmB [Thermoanaerobaculia bacterium]